MRPSLPSSTLVPSSVDKPRKPRFAPFLWREDAARFYGKERGYTVRGGWIFTASGVRLARGWDALAVDLIKSGAIFTEGAFFGVAEQPAQEASTPASPAPAPLEITATEITSDTPIVRVPGLAQDVAPLSCSTPDEQAQEAIAVKRPGPRRPAKGSTPPAAPAQEAPAAPPVLPPVPSKPVKAPPKRPRPAPSAAPVDPYAADRELPSMEPTTREQIKARREVGARRFLDAINHVLSGRGAAAQHSMLAAKGAFRRAAYEAEIATMAEHRDAAERDELDAAHAALLSDEAAAHLHQVAQQRGISPGRAFLDLIGAQDLPDEAVHVGLAIPRPEIAEQAKRLIRERSGGGEGGASGAQGGDPGGPAAPPTKGHTALPRMTPIPPVHPRPRPKRQTLTAPRPAAAPKVARRAAAPPMADLQEALALAI